MDKEERVDGVDCFGNELKVGDLVETCNMLPGFIVWQNPDDKDEVEVITMGKIGQYQCWTRDVMNITCHSIVEHFPCFCPYSKFREIIQPFCECIGHDSNCVL